MVSPYSSAKPYEANFSDLQNPQQRNLAGYRALLRISTQNRASN